MRGKGRVRGSPYGTSVDNPDSTIPCDVVVKKR
jgi:hypothetical protein